MVTTPSLTAGEPDDARGLVGDQLWATWGPPLEHPTPVTDRIIELVARNVDRELDDVADLLLAAPNRCRYILLRRLAETRHSVVYAGVDRHLAREVAIKIHVGCDELVARRATAEARTTSDVEHPNIVRIHDIGEHQGQRYAVTELCDDDLQAWCINADWPEILARILEAGAGLLHLHAAGYVHGDVKPLNILIKQGTARLADFGSAGRLEQQFVVQFGGTPGYIAPEITLGKRTASSDLFALAVTTWACLFGTLPFGTPQGEAGTAIAVGVQRAIDGVIDHPRVIPKGLPRAMIPLLRRALNPDSSRRPSLEKWLAELRDLAMPRDQRPRYRRPAALALGAVALVVGATMLTPAQTPPRSWLSETIEQLASGSAVAKARSGDADGALQLLEHAAARPRDQANSRSLALLSIEVAHALEQHELYADATFAWHLAFRFAWDASDSDLQAKSAAGLQAAVTATTSEPPGPQSR